MQMMLMRMSRTRCQLTRPMFPHFREVTQFTSLILTGLCKKYKLRIASAQGFFLDRLFLFRWPSFRGSLCLPTPRAEGCMVRRTAPA
jgi:hypothetical protein